MGGKEHGTSWAPPWMVMVGRLGLTPNSVRPRIFMRDVCNTCGVCNVGGDESRYCLERNVRWEILSDLEFRARASP